MKAKVFVGVVVALLLVVALVAGMGSQAQAQERAPAIAKQSTYLLYPTTAISGAATTYTASPRNVATGLDASQVNGWANVDVFATVDIATSAYVTLTLQYSADGVNWADADYEYVSNTSAWDSEGITSTATAVTSIETQTHVRYMTADGTELIQAPTAGEFMRVKIENSASITPTIYVTYRN